MVLDTLLDVKVYDPVCAVWAVAWHLELSPAAVTGPFIPDSMMDTFSEQGSDHETPRLETAQTSPIRSYEADAREDRAWCQDRDRSHRTRPRARGGGTQDRPTLEASQGTHAAAKSLWLICGASPDTILYID
jgi:hypothetical protein